MGYELARTIYRMTCDNCGLGAESTTEGWEFDNGWVHFYNLGPVGVDLYAKALVCSEACAAELATVALRALFDAKARAKSTTKVEAA